MVHGHFVGLASKGQVGTVDERDAVHTGQDGDEAPVDLAHCAANKVGVESLVNVDVEVASLGVLVGLVLNVGILDVVGLSLLTVVAVGEVENRCLCLLR